MGRHQGDDVAGAEVDRREHDAHGERQHQNGRARDGVDAGKHDHRNSPRAHRRQPQPLQGADQEGAVEEFLQETGGQSQVDRHQQEEQPPVPGLEKKSAIAVLGQQGPQQGVQIDRLDKRHHPDRREQEQPQHRIAAQVFRAEVEGLPGKPPLPQEKPQRRHGQCKVDGEIQRPHQPLARQPWLQGPVSIHGRPAQVGLVENDDVDVVEEMGKDRQRHQSDDGPGAHAGKYGLRR